MRISLIKLAYDKRLEVLKSRLSEAENYKNNQSEYGNFLAIQSVYITLSLLAVNGTSYYMNQLYSGGSTALDRPYWIVSSFIMIVLNNLSILVAYHCIIKFLSVTVRVSELDSYKLRVEPIIESESQSLED